MKRETIRQQPVTRNLARLASTHRQDARHARAFDVHRGLMPEYQRHVMDHAEILTNKGDLDIWEDRFDAPGNDDEDVQARTFRIATSGAVPELSQSLNAMIEGVNRRLGIADADSIVRGRSRLGSLTSELEGGIRRYAPELELEMGTAVARAVREHGPLGPLYEAMVRNPEAALDDAESGAIDHETLSGALRYSITHPVEQASAQPEITSAEATSLSIDELRSRVRGEAEERFGEDFNAPVGPVDRPGEMPIADIGDLINRISREGEPNYE